MVPRDPPPLYSWEVLPGLYPALPVPRRPKVRVRRLAQGALVAIAVVAIALGATLAVLGNEATTPAYYTVSGTVYEQVGVGGTTPASGATVTLTTDGGSRVVETTTFSGAFSFSRVPVGGISVNVTAPGYAPVTITTFASTVYNTGTSDLSVTLVPGTAANGTAVALSPFPDLESFLASVGSGVVLLGIVAAAGGLAAWVTGRSDRPAVGVVGGSAALLAPVALYFLALGGIFPEVVVGEAVLAALGAFTATVRTMTIVQVGPESRTT